MGDKRKDYISWDEYFMGIATLSGMRSKDPNTQVGACIVSQDNKILSMGYNGLPRGCSDDEFPWNRDGEDNKYFYTTHSELNAILNYRGGSLDNAKLYVTLFPCNECAKAIIQAGIKTVVYDCDKYADTASVIASKRMLNAAGVRYYKYERTGDGRSAKVVPSCQTYAEILVLSSGTGTRLTVFREEIQRDGNPGTILYTQNKWELLYTF